MHQLVILQGSQYETAVAALVREADKRYDTVCYISFRDAYHIVVEMLKQNVADEENYVIVDASETIRGRGSSSRTHIIPVEDLFKVYLFLRSLIKDENIDYVIVDSLSALIEKHSNLPLKEMLTDLLLEFGRANCDSSLVILPHHKTHEVIGHLQPMIFKYTQL